MTFSQMLTGPFLLLSVLICTGGLLGRILRLVRDEGLRGPESATRPDPAASGMGAPCSWIFFGSLLLLILFQPGHDLIRREVTGSTVDLALPLYLSDVLALVALGSLVWMTAGLMRGNRQAVTSWTDWAFLGLSACMLISGMVSRHGSGGNPHPGLVSGAPWLLAHMGFAEILLILAPFTMLSRHLFLIVRRLAGPLARGSRS